ncbi:MAG: pyruvate dehydrogenase complex dihydrolipoamide acetyltransferase [Taibaiella sp.]|nr:pyruvate dehydrogenase complex dihydrolipoamide acetyltransferase [Taibaiella sp.]
MAEAIRMPLLSDTMTQGVIAEWHKKVGDEVKADDVIADVETDKATMEVTPYVDGTLLYIAVDKGQGVPINGIMAIIGKPGEDFQSILDEEPAAKTTASPQTEAAEKKPAGQEEATAAGPQEKVDNAEKPNEQQETVTESKAAPVANVGTAKPEEEAKFATENMPTVVSDAGKDQPKEQNETSAENKPTPVAKAGEATVVRMPLLSDTMTEGKIVAWHKKVGDTVKNDDAIADVETDKATMEVMPYADGVLLYIGVKEGEAAKINDIIAIVGKAGTDITPYLDGNSEPEAQSSQAAPEEKETQGQNPVQTAATAPASAPATPASSQGGQTAPAETEQSGGEERVKASPLAKMLASEKGIDIHQLKGSGDNGRIVKRDIDSYQPPKQATPAAPATAGDKTIPAPVKAQAAPASPQVLGQESHTDVPVSQMRRIIAQRLGESMFTAPHFYLTMTITMDKAMEARKAINEVATAKVSFNDLIIKASAMALRRHPQVNSSWMGDFVRQNHHINIGTAVAVDEGLIVPVIKFADQKSLSQIATEASTLIEKARTKKIQPHEFTGNTFTISNLGMMDIDEFTAIINPPDSCILAVGKITPSAVVENNQVVVRQLMKITLSCDHRVVDGAVGSRFLQTLKQHLENPVTMLA